MARRPRPFLTLRIYPNDPLFKGRMPIDKKEMPDGSVIIRVDPVSLGALYATTGDVMLVDELICVMEAELSKIKNPGGRSPNDEISDPPEQPDEMPEQEPYWEDPLGLPE